MAAAVAPEADALTLGQRLAMYKHNLRVLMNSTCFVAECYVINLERIERIMYAMQF